MINNIYENDKMILLKDSYKKFIFEKLLNQYNCKILAKILQVSTPSIYRYKNAPHVAVPLSLIQKCVNMLENTSLNNNIIKIFQPKELRHKGLNLGRKLRNEQLKMWRSELPEIKDLTKNSSLNLEKWFSTYQKLIDFGARVLESIIIEDNKIIINHRSYVKKEQKHFRLVLPRRIKIDNRFQYFFGLWCGDKVGGGRIGVANKSPELNQITAEYLKNNLYQNPQFVLHKSSRINRLPKLNFSIDKIEEVKDMPGDWVLCVQSVNGILKSFFDYLDQNLDEFLNILPNKNIFFAGLFDAEGNVFLEDKCFRWACMNARKVEIYKKYLKKYGLFHRYDGGNLITNNVKTFSELVLPYLKHKGKINKTQLIWLGKGYLDKKFKNILNVINKNQNKNVSELGRIIGKKKLWPQVKFLEDYKYVKSLGYPKRIFITNKGLTELGREGQ